MFRRHSHTFKHEFGACLKPSSKQVGYSVHGHSANVMLLLDKKRAFCRAFVSTRFSVVFFFFDSSSTATFVSFGDLY